MQSHSMESRTISSELKIVDSSKLPATSPVFRGESSGVIIKGRLARQRGFEVKTLFDRLKQTERRVALLEETLRQIQPHFFDDHPIYKKIVGVLKDKS